MLDWIRQVSGLQAPAAGEIWRDRRSGEAWLIGADKLRLPALKNMKEGAKLGTFLVPGSVVKGLRPGAQRFTSKWLGKFLNQLGAMEERIRRIHFKSLGGILALQEEIIRTWLRDGPRQDLVEEDEEPIEAEAEEDEGGTYRLKD